LDDLLRRINWKENSMMEDLDREAHGDEMGYREENLSLEEMLAARTFKGPRRGSDRSENTLWTIPETH
jgi:hypothetical protein